MTMLQNKTIAELQEQCRKEGVSFKNRMSKKQLIMCLKPTRKPSSSTDSNKSTSSTNTLTTTASSSTPIVITNTTTITNGPAAPTPNSSYASMKKLQLQELCRTCALPREGTKEQLIKRLNQHVGFVRELPK